ncbi:Exopolysaccharide biosynthesis polyprenyl glycosylphosphotransferase [Hyella patelloides LEGE 07179]|uniref:Exopolysaccharide biosynthesis polyprenyl glycosylphosphotransferase n=1 Tax=Hyella patelloides LEGE 07179 TaxID=945734 RepID=A0A563VU23_9CYAN|nr:sugar transferase [Hyella patelloides]VEP14879.1 Exopolysaccharide biosynthesis polyprenyl glycosylphosphotransferase [Hyella patelloides LEGE 07179]
MNSSSSRSTVTWLVFASDICGLILGFNLAFTLRFEEIHQWRSPLAYGLIVVYLLGLYLTDTYRLTEKVSGFWLSERVLLGIIITVFGITCLIYLTGLWGSSPIVGRGILFITVSFFTAWAIACRTIACKWASRNQERSRFLILGDSEKTANFAQEYQTKKSQAEFVLLRESTSQARTNQSFKNSRVIGNSIQAEVNTSIGYGEETSPSLSVISKNTTNSHFKTDTLDNFELWSGQSWSGVLISDSNQELSQSTIRDLMEMRLRGIYVYSFADFCEQFWQKIPPACIEDDWFAFSSGFSILHNPVNVKLKEAIDRVLAAILILVSLPVTIPIAIAVKLDSPGSIFYSQVRTGLNGKKFKVHKFRSMRSDAEKMGVQWAQEKDPRITRSGRFIRMTRIDELPQLWNVLKGEMSLVGPRPERPEFDSQLRQAIPYYDLRYLVKPGITGWAQVCYPYGASVEDAYQKVAYDLYYIKNYSLVLDAAISLKTVRVVILGKGR